MSQPCSMGRQRAGVAVVLSTTTGTPRAWAASAMAARSGIESFGLPIVSRYTAFVRSVMWEAKASASSLSTYSTLIPMRGNVVVKSVTVPP